MEESKHILRSPKKEEVTTMEDGYMRLGPMCSDINVPDELDGFLDLEEKGEVGKQMLPNVEWDFMSWDEFSNEGFIEEENDKLKMAESMEACGTDFIVKRENIGFWEEEEKTISLNLNYQEVLDAWSNGRSPWATDDYDYSVPGACDSYVGVTPIMEEKSRREARVLRYKEKRQSRLFSKKIRYQVRKINADKRPRLKGRFVKRIPDNGTKILR